MSSVGSTGSDVTSATAQLRAYASDTNAQAKRKAAMDAALTAAGADPSKLPDLEKQIQAAVQSSRKNSDGTSDPKTAVGDAVNSVLKQNGLDPAKFDAQMASQRAGHHHRRHGAGGASSTGASTPTAQLLQPAADPDAAVNVVA